MKSLPTVFRVLLFAAIGFSLQATSSALGKDWDEQPSVKKSVSPANPNKLSGMVTATIVIDEKGFVTDAKINKATDPQLEEPVLDAVKKWLFNPAKLEGKAITCTINVPFKFQG